jgi:hypothetical protein
MIRRLTHTLAALAVAAACCASAATADEWHSEQPLTAGSDVPVSLGKVYDIKFWAPNRGVLITADGLWSYDGTGWRRLATVCGGTGGRIAWAGPLDFWTISDQPVGQAGVGGREVERRSLCHVVNGTVVASYAQPIGQATSYLQMNAAICLAADDCWFGGERLPGTVNRGAFHLHWDGHALAAVPSLTAREPAIADPDRAVGDFAVHQGALYESVRVDGNAVDGEPSDQPYVLHEIFPGTPPAFVPLFPAAPIDYGGRPPATLGALQLSTDGAQLWAAAGTNDPNKPMPVTILLLGPDGFAPLTLTDPGGLLAPAGTVTSIAAEPGTDSAWVGYWPSADSGQSKFPARLVRVHADGTVDGETTLPSAADGIARKQQADRLACPAPGQCWMSTQEGWLFHLGGDLPRDDEPAMHRLISYRPPDAATVSLSPDPLPDDDSGIAPPVFDQPPPEGFTPPATTPTKTKVKKLVTGVKRRLIGRTTLELRFTLTAKARVQLVAKRRKLVVASTKRATLGKGKHVLRLRLSAKRWPTKLDLRAVPVKKAATEPTAGSGTDSAQADDNPDAAPVTIASVPRGAKR